MTGGDPQPEPGSGSRGSVPNAAERDLVAAQLRRVPRDPWRVAARCTWGFPTAIVSPSRLDDGTPFPTYAWLTCPYLSEIVAARESQGDAAQWAALATADNPAGRQLAAQLHETDAALRAARTRESGGEDACAGVGLGGQRGPLGVKCLHVHLALELVGIPDPIGDALLGKIGSARACPDDRCARLTQDAEAARAASAKEDR